MPSRKRILVTGANGLLGRRLSKRLQELGFDVIRQARSGPDAVSGDLSDPEVAARILRDSSPESIVHLASLTNVDLCEQNPIRAYLDNVRPVENICRWILGNQSDCFLVHISTDHVYDGAGPHAEDAACPANYYALSKYAGELAALRVRSTILRTNFFGRSASPGRLSITDWLCEGYREGKAIRVFEDVFFSPLSIATLIDMIAIVIDRRHAGVFNVGSREGMSKADFALRFFEALEVPSSKLMRVAESSVGLKAHRPKDMRMVCKRFESIFNIIVPSLLDEIGKVREEYRHVNK